MDKSIPIFGLDKVPDSELIKKLRFEIGVLQSEVQELREDREPVIHKHAANSAYIISLEGQVKNLQKRIKNLEDEGKLNYLEEENNILKEKLAISNKRIVILEKELLNNLTIKL